MDSAATLLHAGQTLVVTSHQPLYALSNRVQETRAHKFVQGKYFSIFGGLHIDKLLHEIQGQLIADSGLPRSINRLKISITGAGNIALNVSNVLGYS